MNDQICKFIAKQQCASICCRDKEGNPYCFNCFYAFDPSGMFLCFKSSMDTRHAKLLIGFNQVAGTILPDKLSALKVQGIQFTGKVLHVTQQDDHKFSSLYHKRYPFALAMPGEIWTIRIDEVKLTDSTLGFGKKISWNRDQILHN